MTSFLKDESGAITVDWVVLAAGLVAVSIATMAVVSSGLEAGATDIDEELSTQIIRTSFAAPSGPETPAPFTVDPYTPFYDFIYDNNVNLYNGAFSDQANVDARYTNDMTAAYAAVSTTPHASIAQSNIDALRAAEAVAANKGYTPPTVTIDGQNVNADALEDLYHTRFPS